MFKNITSLMVLGVIVMAVCGIARAALHVTPVAAMPDKLSDKMQPANPQSIVLAGGCFWGVEAVFDHTKGVIKAVSGYAGGKEDTAHYNRVSDGDTGHAESVQITYDPAQVTLDQLLDIYFKVAHDPTQLNHQGPDQGTQYRSAVFTSNPEQQKMVTEKIAALSATHEYSQPIVTTVEPLKAFYAAESYHQNYLAQNPANPYIIMHDMPKLAKLRVSYPELYKP